jgi:hypothetical protein
LRYRFRRDAAGARLRLRFAELGLSIARRLFEEHEEADLPRRIRLDRDDFKVEWPVAAV